MGNLCRQRSNLCNRITALPCIAETAPARASCCLFRDSKTPQPLRGLTKAGMHACYQVRINKEGTAPVRTKLAISANGARERQPQNLKGGNTGGCEHFYPLPGKNRGFQYIWRHVPETIFSFRERQEWCKRRAGLRTRAQRVTRHCTLRKYYECTNAATAVCSN